MVRLRLPGPGTSNFAPIAIHKIGLNLQNAIDMMTEQSGKG